MNRIFSGIYDKIGYWCGGFLNEPDDVCARYTGDVRMANIMDYLDWRGDIPFSVDPFNDVDSLILCELTYVAFDRIVPGPDDAYGTVSVTEVPMPDPKEGTEFPRETDNTSETSTEQDKNRLVRIGEMPCISIADATKQFWKQHTAEEIKKSGTLFRQAPFLLKKLCSGARFGGMYLAGYVNQVSKEQNEQMAAIVYFLEDGSAYVAFRGTDDTLIGWKEDFSFSFRKETGGQKSAAKYLSYIMEKIMGTVERDAPRVPAPTPGVDGEKRGKVSENGKSGIMGVLSRTSGIDGEKRGKVSENGKSGTMGVLSRTSGIVVEKWTAGKIPVRVGGHSKGGNFAVYASVLCPEHMRSWITDIYSFDAPGFLAGFVESEEYKNIVPMIHSVVPEESLFGLLLESGHNHEVAKSSAKGIWQHDALSWKVMRNQFEKADGLSESSVMLENAVESWIIGMTVRERKEFVDTLFTLADDSGIENMSELTTDQFRSVPELLRAYFEMDNDDKIMLQDAVSKLVRSGRESLSEELWGKLLGLWKDIGQKKKISD